MSLKLQTISVCSSKSERLTVTVPAEHIYPFIIHRSVSEWLEKQKGERTRYSKKLIVTHLLTGGLIAVFTNYDDAKGFVRKIKDHSIWLMPDPDLFPSHPDYYAYSDKIKRLKRQYSAIEY